MINSVLAKEGKAKENCLRSLNLDDIPSNNEQVMENVEDNENVGFNDAPNSNEDDVHLVEGQAQDDVFVVPPLGGGCSY